MSLLKSLAAVAVLAAAPGALAQPAAVPPPYGAPIPLAIARKAVEAAEMEARKNNWGMAIAVLDTTGSLAMFVKLDSTQTASVAIAQAKARTALDLRRPTKAVQDGVAAGGVGLRALAIPGIMPIDGGFPIVIDGKVVGAIGVSGGAAEQDAQVAKAGADAAH